MGSPCPKTGPVQTPVLRRGRRFRVSRSWSTFRWVGLPVGTPLLTRKSKNRQGDENLAHACAVVGRGTDVPRPDSFGMDERYSDGSVRQLPRTITTCESECSHPDPDPIPVPKSRVWVHRIPGRVLPGTHVPFRPRGARGVRAPQVKTPSLSPLLGTPPKCPDVHRGQEFSEE